MSRRIPFRPHVRLLEDRINPTLNFNFIFNDPGNEFAQFPLLLNNLQAAGTVLSNLLDGRGSLEVQVNVDKSFGGATGGALAVKEIAKQNGVSIVELGTIYEARTGTDPNGGSADMQINLNPDSLAIYYWFDPSGAARTAPVPSDAAGDFISLALHEMLHGLGFQGYREAEGAAYGTFPLNTMSTFDQKTAFGAGGDPSIVYFTGNNAQAVYGGPVPITSLGGDDPHARSNFGHLGNPPGKPGDDLLDDVMAGVADSFTTSSFRNWPRKLDSAILTDLGWSLSPTIDATGPRITDAKFSGTKNGTLDTVILTFSEPVQRFDETNVTATTPNGPQNFVVVNEVAGSNGTKFEVQIGFSSQSGTYSVNVQPGIADRFGNRMDQNGNGLGGESSDSFSASAVIAGPQVIAAVFSGVTQGTFDKITLTFSQAVEASTVNATNVSLTGPNGAIAPAAITATGFDGTEFEVSFAAQSTAGNYTLKAGTGILDLGGNQLDQNGIAPAGQSSTSPTGDEFSATRALGVTGRRFLALGQADGSVKILDGDTGNEISFFFRPLDANGQTYQSLVSVALADVTGDGIDDLFVAPTKRAGIAGLDPSVAGRVFLFDGSNFLSNFGFVGAPIDTFTPFATNFEGTQTYETGFEIATGDVNGDGVVDLIAASRGDVGQIIVQSTAAGHAQIGAIPGMPNGAATPFGSDYRGKVSVAVGNFLDEGAGQRDDEIAAARGNTDSINGSTATSTRAAMYDLAGNTLTSVAFSGAISSTGVPSTIAGDAGQVIDRNAFVQAIDPNDSGVDLLLFAARDYVSNSANARIRFAVYEIDATGSASLRNSGVLGNKVGSFAIASSDIDGDGQQVLAFAADGPSASTLYIDPLSGETLGGFNANILVGGVRVSSN